MPFKQAPHIRFTTLSYPFSTSFRARCSGAPSRLSRPTTNLSCPFLPSCHTPTFKAPSASTVDLLKPLYWDDEPSLIAAFILRFLIRRFYLNRHTDVSMRNEGMLVLSARTASNALKIVFRGHVSVATARKSRTMRPAAAVAAPARR
jgi:hypothetical protein